MAIPDAVVEEVRATADIVEVVGDYVRLKPSGGRFKGLCPFHNEKSPSFSVDPDQGLFYCFGCLDEDEPIWTDRGLIRIGSVRPGDRVLGLNGQAETVREAWSKRAPVRALHLDAIRRDPLQLTADHVCMIVPAALAEKGVPMLYREHGRGVRFQSRRRRYAIARPLRAEPRQAAEVRAGDYVLFPVIPLEDRADRPLEMEPIGSPDRRLVAAGMSAAAPWPRAKGPAPRQVASFPINPATARLIGLWLAEGSIYRGGVRWSFHLDEQPYAEFVADTLRTELGLAATIHRRPERTLVEVTCSNTHLARILPRHFGQGAEGKRVPWAALFWRPETQNALLEGYLDGDGAREPGGHATAESVSAALVRGLFALGIQAARCVTMGTGTERPGRQPTWRLNVRVKEGRDAFYHEADGQQAYWLRVGANEEVPGERTVVDIETTGSHTFTTKLGAVHNCQKGGDLFTFVREIEGLGFLETVRQLAERYHIEIPEDGPADPAQTEREAILQVLRFAAGFFFKQLQTPEGEACFAYLRERGLTKATIRSFGLGYAPKRWDALVEAATAEGYKPELLVRAGLAKERRGGGGLYDLFRGRAMFPILSHVGKVLAFGGRVIPGVTEPFGDGDPPKYINSPETPVYHKSDVLYGLYQARRAVRQAEELIMVEGYTDVIALHQAGVPLAVASSGTALTPQQVRLAARYAKTIVLLYDADRAGAAAALRGVDLVLEAGLVPYAVTLPDGADPDSFVKLAGADGFRTYLQEHRQDFVAFHAATARREGLLDAPEGMAEAAGRVLDAVAKIRDPIMQDGYIIRAGAELGVPDNTLREQLRTRFRQQRETPPERPRPPARGADRSDSEPSEPPPPPVFAEPKPEEAALLRLMLEHGAPMVEHVLTKMGLGEFSAGAVREAAGHLMAQYQAGPVEKRPFLEGEYGAGVQALAASVLADRYGVSQSHKAMEVTGSATPQQDAAPYEAATSAMKFLKLDRVDEAIGAVNQASHAAKDDEEALTSLRMKMVQLQKLKRSIETGAFFEDANTPSA